MLINDFSKRQQQSEYTQQSVLRWMLQETFSTSDVIAEYLGYTRQGAWKILKRLEKLALLRSAQVPVVNRSKITLWGLSAHGLAYAADTVEDLEIGHVFEPSRVAISMLAHHLDLQKARINAEKAEWQVWKRGEHLGFRVPNRPDAIVLDPNGVSVAIELERTVKTVKRYRQIMAAHLLAIKQGKWDRVDYISPGRNLVPRLQRIFQSIDYVVITGSRIPVHEKHHARFSFYLLDDWPRLEK